MKTYLIIIACVLGLAAGMVTATGTQDTYCDDIEEEVIERDRLEGSFACFDPEKIEIELSEEVEQASELECVCRLERNGVAQYIPISHTN